jgi:predicted RNA binding protein YcfA (HicA-like mRNA interferase family)
MNSMSGKELAKLLELDGWILLRIQGSHHIYGKSGIPGFLTTSLKAL